MGAVDVLCFNTPRCNSVFARLSRPSNFSGPYFLRKSCLKKIKLSHGPSTLQLTHSIVDNLYIYNNSTMIPSKQLPPPLILLNPMFNPLLIENMADNINSTHTVVSIIIDVWSLKLYLPQRNKTG